MTARLEAIKRMLMALVMTWGLLTPLTGHAQQAPITDEQRRFLEVRRRQIELKEARTQLQRTEELFEQGLVSRTELDRARTAVEMAQLNYQEAVLSLLSLQPRISVRQAIKYQTRDGRKWVRLTVANLTPTFDDTQFRLLSNFEGAEPIPEALRTRTVRDIFISLRDAGTPGPNGQPVSRGTTIALPYEVHIPELKYGQSRTIAFQLLRDVQSVIVAASYKGQQQEIQIQLQQAETGNVVTITATQISQEADLGSQATYDLRLERSTVDVRRFQLKVLNLPRQISYSFLDPETQARLQQINFPAGVTEQRLGLRLFLPERADEDVRIDEPLAFWAVVMNDKQAARFSQDRHYTPEEIRRSRAGAVRLEIIPRGVGRIEVSAVSLYSEIQVGEAVETNLTIRNTGTRRLDNIRLTAEYPLNWQVELVPDIIPALEINREERVQLKILPPPDVPVGDYEVRIKTESYAYNRRVPSEDKIYRVSVKARTNVWGMAGLIGALLLLVIGIVVFGIKLTRR